MLLDAKELRLLAGDSLTGTDEQLSMLIEAASGLIETRLGRRLEYDDYTQQKFASGRTVLLEAWPVEKIRSVTMNGETVNGWLLDADHGILMLPDGCCGLLTVKYTGGPEDIPAALKQACALTVLAMSRAIENGGQTLMSERLGDYQMMYYNNPAGSAIPALSPAAEALIAPYRGRGW